MNRTAPAIVAAATDSDIGEPWQERTLDFLYTFEFLLHCTNPNTTWILRDFHMTIAHILRAIHNEGSTHRQ